MSHGDHNHYFFKKDLTPEQIKAAQDHLRSKTPVTQVHLMMITMKIIMGTIVMRSIIMVLMQIESLVKM